jgi:hypothetical protein
MRFPLALILVMLASTAHAQSREQKPVDWRTFEIPDFGTRIQYPAGIFSPAGKPEKGVGQRFERADGRAVLSIYSRPNEAGDNPATYLRSNLRLSRSALDYTRITRSFFAISSERAGVILYSRCNFSGGALDRSFGQKGFWDWPEQGPPNKRPAEAGWLMRYLSAIVAPLGI